MTTNLPFPGLLGCRKLLQAFASVRNVHIPCVGDEIRAKSCDHEGIRPQSIVSLRVYYFSCRMLARSQWPEGPATGHLLTGFLTFICLRDTLLSYDVAHRAVRSWRQNSFRCFSQRWPWNTLHNRMCGVACCRKEGGGCFQQYVNNRYKIVFYPGLRSDCIKNHVSRNETRRIADMRIIFTRISCILFTCDMYMCHLRHINDPVLSSLKMEGIRLLFILGFPVSKSECWDGSQYSKLLPQCFSCSPPELNFLDIYFIFMYLHYNHCHRATARLENTVLQLFWCNYSWCSYRQFLC
jgi:hypothetical protein